MKLAADGSFGRITLLLADETDRVWGFYGKVSGKREPGMPLTSLLERGAQKSSYSIADGKIKLYSFVGVMESLGRIRLNVLVMLFIILISLLSAIRLISYIRKEILNPMKNMKDNMERIRQGSDNIDKEKLLNEVLSSGGSDSRELYLETEYGSSEFSILRDTFNRLMAEIVGLKIKSYEKKLELQETELKCVRLQIRPHFFLNAMTTISSLSMQQRNQEIKTYIDALSKNIRYMFKSGLHTVALGEEIRHVENYFAMQELKYPGCVFYSVELEAGLPEWRIPQMILHTIIENEYKYAVAVGHY